MQPRPSSSVGQYLVTSSGGSNLLIAGVYSSTSIGPPQSTPSSAPNLCTSPSATKVEQTQLFSHLSNDSTSLAFASLICVPLTKQRLLDCCFFHKQTAANQRHFYILLLLRQLLRLPFQTCYRRVGQEPTQDPASCSAP
ncbi:hypothetical protein BHE74_00021598 [Ensete ventricosum]|nr:hypothetical protein BHE74_00021598 [Ensete ventricosum]